MKWGKPIPRIQQSCSTKKMIHRRKRSFCMNVESVRLTRYEPKRFFFQRLSGRWFECAPYYYMWVGSFHKFTQCPWECHMIWLWATTVYSSITDFNNFYANWKLQRSESSRLPKWTKSFRIFHYTHTQFGDIQKKSKSSNTFVNLSFVFIFFLDVPV